MQRRVERTCILAVTAIPILCASLGIWGCQTDTSPKSAALTYETAVGEALYPEKIQTEETVQVPVPEKNPQP